MATYPKNKEEMATHLHRERRWAPIHSEEEQGTPLLEFMRILSIVNYNASFGKWTWNFLLGVGSVFYLDRHVGKTLLDNCVWGASGNFHIDS